jgi:hypothetical protein
VSFAEPVADGLRLVTEYLTAFGYDNEAILNDAASMRLVRAAAAGRHASSA